VTDGAFLPSFPTEAELRFEAISIPCNEPAFFDCDDDATVSPTNGGRLGFDDGTKVA
jgi:hypothetical protein